MQYFSSRPHMSGTEKVRTVVAERHVALSLRCGDTCNEVGFVFGESNGWDRNADLLRDIASAALNLADEADRRADQ